MMRFNGNCGYDEGEPKEGEQSPLAELEKSVRTVIDSAPSMFVRFFVIAQLRALGGTRNPKIRKPAAFAFRSADARRRFSLPSRVAVFGLLLGANACARAPTGFLEAEERRWSTIELRGGLSYDAAWDSVFERIATNFAIVYSSKEDGYLLTDWESMHVLSALGTYRTRIAIKFAADRGTVRISTTALFVKRSGATLFGIDTEVAETTKNDLIGLLGRVAR